MKEVKRIMTMKKLLASASALATSGLIAAGFAFAGDPAVVIKDGGCTLLAADGTFFAAESAQAVKSGGESGNSKITCTAQQPETVTNPDKAVMFSGETTPLLCSTTFGTTANWKAVITPSGKAMLSCHYNSSAT